MFTKEINKANDIVIQIKGIHGFWVNRITEQCQSSIKHGKSVILADLPSIPLQAGVKDFNICDGFVKSFKKFEDSIDHETIMEITLFNTEGGLKNE